MVNPYGERTIASASAAYKVSRTFSSSSKLIKQRYSARWEQQQLRETCLRDYVFVGGDLIVGKDETLFFALDENWVVYMEVIDAERKQATFRCVSVDSSWGGTLVKSRTYFPFGGGKGISLAWVFVDRIVPYHHRTCNQAHYMDYFTLGKVRSVLGRSNLGKDCPLHRTDFINVMIGEISANTFYLLKGDRRSRVYPSNFPSAPPPIPSNSPSPPALFTGVGQYRSPSPSRRTDVPESSTNRHRRSVSAPAMGRTSTYFRSPNFPW